MWQTARIRNTLTVGGNMTFNPFGFISGKSSLEVEMSFISRYWAPGRRGPASNLVEAVE